MFQQETDLDFKFRWTCASRMHIIIYILDKYHVKCAGFARKTAQFQNFKKATLLEMKYICRVVTLSLYLC